MPRLSPPPADVLDHDLSDGRVRLDADKLKQLRRQRGLSQSLLADLARDQGRPISIASIKRAELGTPVLYRTAQQMAEIFGVELSELQVQVPDGGDDPGAGVDGLTMVGRAGERRLFQTVLEEARQERRGRFVYVRGPAGMGKTRLLAEWRHMAERAGLRVIGCEVQAYGAGGIGYLAQMLLDFFELPGEIADKHALSDQLRRQLPRMGLDEGLALALSPLMQLPLASDHLPLYQAMSHETRLKKRGQALLALIRHACRERAVLLLMEDMHWADPHMLDVVAPLIFATREDPVVWVLTSRVEKDPLERSIRPYLSDVPVTVMDLAPLSQDEARALAGQVPEVAPARLAECIAQARGNPLFLTQLLLHPDRDSLPESLHALVRAKLQQLPELDRQAVTIASVAGAEFPLALLRRLLGQADYLPTEPLAQHMFRACGTGSYAFVHDLIRQGIISETPPSTRQNLYERLAQYHRGDDPRQHAVYLDKARHAQAPAALMVAIEHCCEQFRHEEALELARRYAAVDYAELNLYRLHLLQGRISLGMGRPQEARAHLEEALQRAPDDPARMPAAVLLARALNLLDELQLEEELLQAQIPVAIGLKDSVHLAQLYHLRGNLMFPRGRYRESRLLHTAARRQARLARDPRTEAQALSGLGDSYYAQGRMLTATETFRHCLRLCERHGLADVEASNRFMLATTRLYLNETLGALGDALASAEIAHRVGNRRAEIVSRLTAGWLYLSLNQPAQAQREFEQALRIARALGAARFEPFLLEGVARTLRLQGDAPAALQTIREAWEMVERQKLHRFIGPWVLGTRALLSEDGHERQQAIAQGLQIVQDGCVAHNVYRFCVAAAEAHIASRQPAQATALADRLQAFTAAEPCPWVDHHLRLIRAHVQRLLRPFDPERQALDALIAAGLLAGIGHASPVLHEVMPGPTQTR